MGSETRLPSYWESRATFEGASSVDKALWSQTDVLIVGGGFMGLWLAHFLLKKNPQLKLIVLERDRFAYGASSRNAGFLTTGHVSELLADSRETSIDLVVENCLARRAGLDIVLEEFGGELDVLACGSADFDPIDQQRRDFVEMINAAFSERGSSLRFETRHVAFAGQEREVFFNPADGGIQPVQLLNLLASSICERGGRILRGAEVCALAQGHAEYRMPDGDERSLRYQAAYLCTNAFAGELSASSNVVPGRGQVIVTSPVTMATQACLGYLNDGYDYFRSVDGRLLIGGGRHLFRENEQSSELKTTPHVIEYLKEQARVVIGHDDWTIDAQWAGIMGFPNGAHMACLGPRTIDSKTHELTGFGGMGVALTPWVAKRVATDM